MTREDTKTVLSTIRGYYPSEFSKLTKTTAEAMLSTWEKEFSHSDVNEVLEAFDSYKRTARFAPTVYQIKQLMPSYKYVNAIKRSLSQVDWNVAGRVSRYAREHGITWEEAKAIVG